MTKEVWLVTYPNDARAYVSAWEPDPERMACIRAAGGEVWRYVLHLPGPEDVEPEAFGD